MNRIKALLRFLSLDDETGNLSLAGLFSYVLIVKVIVSQSIDMQSAACLLACFAKTSHESILAQAANQLPILKSVISQEKNLPVNPMLGAMAHEGGSTNSGSVV